MNRLFASTLVLLMTVCTLSAAQAQGAKAALAGDALASPDIYMMLDVPAAWNLLVGPIEKLAAQPAIKNDATLGPQFNMLLTAITSEVTRPFQAFGLDPLHDLKTVTFSVKLGPSAFQALCVVRGDLGKSRLGELLGSSGDTIETVNGKELHIAKETDLGFGGRIRPAYYMTATEWVLGDDASVRAAASAKNMAAGKVAGPAAGVQVPKAAFVMAASFATLRNSFVGPIVMMDRDAKTILEMFDDAGIGISEKELKFSVYLPNATIGNAALDFAAGINEWLKMLPSFVKGAGLMMSGVHGVIPEEFPDELQGLFADRKLYLQLVDGLAAMVKATGSASYKANRFEWKLQGTVGSATMVGVLAGVGMWFIAARSAPAPYYPEQPYPEEPYPYDGGQGGDGKQIEPTPVDDAPNPNPQDSMERDLNVD